MLSQRTYWAGGGATTFSRLFVLVALISTVALTAGWVLSSEAAGVRPATVTGPYLAITSGTLTATPSTVVAGGKVTLSPWTVKNEGTAASGGFSNGFYLSTDSTIDTGDTYLDGNSNTSLAPGTSFAWGGPKLTIPANTPAGTYYIGILVDRTNKVTSQSIKPTVYTQITVTGPNLVITSGTPTATPSTVMAGAKVTLSGWTVKNTGGAASGAFSNGFYLSTDSTIDTKDTYLDGNSNNSLAPGASFTWGGPTLTIPVNTPAGAYYIGVLVDNTNKVNQSVKPYVCAKITVTAAAPDLVITSGAPTATPSTVKAGGKVTLSAWTVKNVGTLGSGGFSNGFYLSTDSTISSGDTYLDGNSNGSLAPGAQFNWGAPTLTIPANTPPGTYYIGILVDNTNKVNQSVKPYVYAKITVTPNAPLAYGVVTGAGVSESGTDNWSVNFNQSSKLYTITISGENYFYQNYTTVVTPSFTTGVGGYCTTGSVSGNLLVNCYNESGSPIEPVSFAFLSYKTDGDALAFGVVTGAGGKYSGTQNWTSTYDSANNRYAITISGENYLYSNYSTVATPSFQTGVEGYCTTSSVSNNLLVYCYDNSGHAVVPVSFSFLSYKSGGKALAFGAVSSSGAKDSGTGNWTSSYDSTHKWYAITIKGENYLYTAYSTLITPSFGTGSEGYCTAGSVADQLLVSCYNNSGSPVKPVSFSFVTYK